MRLTLALRLLATPPSRPLCIYPYNTRINGTLATRDFASPNLDYISCTSGRLWWCARIKLVHLVNAMTFCMTET